MTSINELNGYNKGYSAGLVKGTKTYRAHYVSLLIAVRALPEDMQEKVQHHYKRNFKNMEPDAPFVPEGDTQEADHERTQQEERVADQFDNPKT